MRFLNKLRASRRASEGVEALIRRRRRLLGKGSSLAFMRTGWCGYHHLYIFCYIKLWLLIVLYIRYILILFLLYINIDINIYVYIYIYVYAVYDFCYHTIQIYTLWSAYIYIDINSYIMILYTCCDIKHACIHWTFGESNMPWARGQFLSAPPPMFPPQHPGVGTTCATVGSTNQKLHINILTFDLLFLWKAASALDVILWDHVHCQS